jgi:type IV pilus assembly protein PilV
MWMPTIHASVEAEGRMKSKPEHFRQRRAARSAAGGVVLIEALVGLLIFSFGVLGLIGLQASMSKAQTGAKFRADASNLTAELLGVMWSDSAAHLSQYASASCDDYSRCADWKRKLQTQLPAADATVTVDATSGEVNITIVWTQPGEGEHRYISSAMVQP